MSERNEFWYDEFWGRIDPDEDDMTTAVRLIGEMFDEFVVERSGDDLLGQNCMSMTLGTSDLYLIRRIEDAARAARSAMDAES